MPSVVEGFLAVADAVGQVAVAGKVAAASFREATKEAKDYTAAAKEAASAEARLTEARYRNSKGSSSSSDTTGETAGKSRQGSGSSTSVGATSLGDPRDAEDQSARMIAAIEAAKRR